MWLIQRDSTSFPRFGICGWSAKSPTGIGSDFRQIQEPGLRCDAPSKGYALCSHDARVHPIILGAAGSRSRSQERRKAQGAQRDPRDTLWTMSGLARSDPEHRERLAALSALDPPA